MWFQVLSFLTYYIRAGTRYNVQSPFLYDFAQEILDTTKEYYAFIRLEGERKRLLADERILDIIDLGAGSKVSGSKHLKVSEIAKSAVSHQEKCRILFNLVNYYQCKSILEIGSSLGISSSYLAWANLHARVTTCEGDPAIASIAKELHQRLGLENISIITGDFADTLTKVLIDDEQYDLVFLDGNHLYEPTIDYFYKILPHLHTQAIIILDDIYWSSEMTKAWRMLQKEVSVRLSIDLFDMGILFLNPSLSKQDVTYISYRYKPWRVGLFG